MKLSREAINDIQRRAFFQSPDEISIFIAREAAEHNVTTRRIRQILPIIQNSTRASRHSTKIEITETQWNYFVGLRFKGYASWHIIETAEQHGVIEPGLVSPALLNRRFLEAGLGHARLTSDRKPARRIVRSGVNVMGHTDWTKREELFIDRDRMVYFAPKKRKNQHGEKLPSIWLASGMDDYSRATYMRFYLDENARNQCDFLRRWFSPKENLAEFPAHGLFSQIYMDLGPVNMSAPVQNTLKGVNTFVVPTKPSTWGPYDSRKHGKPERQFRTFDEYFLELPDILPMHFDELQEWLYSKLLHYNNRRHSTTGHAPFALWSTIQCVRLAPSPEIFSFLSQTREQRVVNKHLELSVDGNHFHLHEARERALDANKRIEDLVGERVEVFYSFSDFSAVTVCYPGFPDLPLTRCNNPQCYSTVTPEWQPTTIDKAREEVAAIDYRRPWRQGAANPRHLAQREARGFDETKVATKFAIDAQGNRVPTHEDDKPFEDWMSAGGVLVELEIFPRPLNDIDKDWLKNLISTRGKIAKDELIALARDYKQQQGVNFADVDESAR